MRDINRLDSFYDALKEIHKDHFPDWRFGQLVCNLQLWYENDLFYVEEDKMLKILNEFSKG